MLRRLNLEIQFLNIGIEEETMKAQKLLIPACILLMAAPAVANEHMEAISDWSDKQKQTVQEMVDQYGEPDGIMNSRVVWTDPEGD